MSGASCSCFCYRGNSHSIENYGPKNSHATCANFLARRPVCPLLGREILASRRINDTAQRSASKLEPVALEPQPSSAHTP
eukprot:COSAG02_NODE_3014_length_7551_cov_83.019995_11_plen_80_part_00